MSKITVEVTPAPPEVAIASTPKEIRKLLCDVTAAYEKLTKVAARTTENTRAANQPRDDFDDAFKALKEASREKAQQWCTLFDTHMSVESVDFFA